MRRVSTPLAFALGLLVVAVASAQDEVRDVSGTYTLKGKIGWWFAPKVTTRLTLTRTGDTTYDVRRVVTWDDSDHTTGALNGTATAELKRKGKVELKVTWPAVEGAANRVADLLEGGRLSHGDLAGTYQVKKDGWIRGWVETPKRNGQVKRIKEKGDADVDVTTAGDENAKPVDEAFSIKGLSSGVYLVGSAPKFELEPSDATLVILYGENAKVDGRRLVFEGPGVVRVQAQKGEKGSPIVNMQAVSAEVTEVSIKTAVELEDAPAPHFSRKLGQKADAAFEPAVILVGQPLELELTIKAEKSLTAGTKLKLTGRGDDGLSFEEEVELQDLAAGQAITIKSKGALNDAVAINAVDIDWFVESVGDTEIGTTGLRVYTTLRAPVDNPMPRYAPSSRQGKPLKTKLHYELACWWAEGRSKNVGDGGDSICHKVDNMFRHLSHWEDLGSFEPVVPHYPKGADAPKNYDDLRGSVSSSTGERSNVSLYYPPLKPDEDYEQYRHYRNNFGWWVLENPKHTGGRCNQQASLICDVFGTLGVKAEVYYIERVGRGKESGRAMRRYYKSSRSSKSWNFHGQAKAYLDDGTEWLYDGSGSSPNTRINGRVEELMKVPSGPYIDYWNPWRYEDGSRTYAPESDWPDTWRGVPLQPGETE